MNIYNFASSTFFQILQRNQIKTYTTQVWESNELNPSPLSGSASQWHHEGYMHTHIHRQQYPRPPLPATFLLALVQSSFQQWYFQACGLKGLGFCCFSWGLFHLIWFSNKEHVPNKILCKTSLYKIEKSWYPSYSTEGNLKPPCLSAFSLTPPPPL
jgi:hypothetical protein